MAGGPERRHGQRVAVKKWDVVYHRRKNWFFFEKGQFKSPIIDISDGGMSLMASEYLPIGTNLNLRFQLDDQPQDTPEELDVQGVVVYSLPVEDESGGYRIGLRFVGNSEDKCETIHDMIQKALQPET